MGRTRERETHSFNTKKEAKEWARNREKQNHEDQKEHSCAYDYQEHGG